MIGDVARSLENEPNYRVRRGQMPTLETVHLLGATGEPALAGTWVVAGGSWLAPGFYKDPFGIVHLFGNVKSGTIASTVFTLPTGYRPSADIVFATATGAWAYGTVKITSAGVVSVESGTNTHVSFEGITFRAL